MKVALLSDCYLPRLGGIEVQVHDLARHLQGAGHEVEAFTATRGPARRRRGTDIVDGIPVHRLAAPLPRDLPVNPLAVPVVRSMLRAGGFDVAHVHMGVVSPFAMDCVRVALGLQLPTAVTWHCVQAHLVPAVRAAGYVARWARRGAVLSAVSKVAAAPIAELAGPLQRVAVLPNGIDVDRWAPQSRGLRPGVRIVSAMRLMTRKRPVQLLEMVAEVRRQVPGSGIRLDVLGEGPLRPRLERAARDLGAQSWFSAPGRMSRDALREQYLRSDVYVAPAQLEAFGIAALEARTTGLPVVAPRRSGVSEFVEDGVNGLLGGDDRGLVEALVRLAREEELRRRITVHNETHPPREQWSYVVQAVLAEYHRAQGRA
ncbi:glycosyltransferase family 4 protein [Leekyejoonella antrihumi]|uniref:D-inositol 3-phosphate glycosyltransferase n=1 Tax=Leekyejoonella antrihumi TaxID=1660198 RepID=A0A563E244_9MICO|nr:glycosyltransferase family 4 protein [Leekyejoonella antrihumi]TWP35974.1 glycosyltransferase family 4 protein [Leekyejoonella antrihumi]